MNETNESSAPQRVPRGVVVLTMIAGFMACFGVVTAVGALGEDEATNLHTGGPVTERAVVASGDLPQSGPWKLYHSFDADGNDCFEFGVLTGPPGQRGEALYGGCGGRPILSTASLTPAAGDYTIVHGNARKDVVEIRVDGDGIAEQRVSRLKDGGASNQDVFAVEVPGTPTNLTVRAFDADGRTISAQRVPTPPTVDAR